MAIPILQNLLYCLLKQFVVIVVNYSLGFIDFPGFLNTSLIFIGMIFVKVGYNFTEYNCMHKNCTSAWIREGQEN